MLNKRLLSDNRFYQNIDETAQQFGPKKSTKEKGIESQLIWKLNKQWSLFASANYSSAALYNKQHKKRFEGLLAGRIHLSSAII
ncbi:hypothetical protein JI57_03035 [Psychromonas sp. PRT-SC03]|nr:hypothetical protein JI57_03035 [Psychromonas sp. PRT-SC03]